jgi:uncharacterized membrane-anchored protein
MVVLKMRVFKFVLPTLLIFLSLFGFSKNLNAAEEDALSNEEVERFIELFSLDWKETGTYKLPNSHSTLSLPDERLLVIGEDARQATQLCGTGPDDYVEAITLDGEFENSVYFSFVDDGYVSLADWEKVNPQQLLEAISENTEKSNKIRESKGISALHVVGWLLEPTLDRNTNTVFWAIEGVDEGDDKHIANSVALRECLQIKNQFASLS